jgi:hypothetical protein
MRCRGWKGSDKQAAIITGDLTKLPHKAAQLADQILTGF